MFNDLLKKLSILKKFLFINFIFFSIISVFTILYLKTVQPNLIQKKTFCENKIKTSVFSKSLRMKIKKLVDRKKDKLIERKNSTNPITNQPPINQPQSQHQPPQHQKPQRQPTSHNTNQLTTNQSLSHQPP